MDLSLHRRPRRFHRRSCVAQSHLGEDHCYGGEEDFFGSWSCESTFFFCFSKIRKESLPSFKNKVSSGVLGGAACSLTCWLIHASTYEGHFLFASYLSFYLWRLLSFLLLIWASTLIYTSIYNIWRSLSFLSNLISDNYCVRLDMTCYRVHLWPSN